jgi:hypothetical protein
MNLQYAANAVQQQGRGEDSMLVHMTPNEVGGLQALAMANGGSLSINPETGLPEAGFLKNILPTLIGAGLTIFSGGAINPMTAAMITGGFETVRTGDIGKGLMAGLGAYGGAGLGGAFMGAGNAALGTQAAMSPDLVAAAQPAAGMMGNLQTTGVGAQNILGMGSAATPAATTAAREAFIGQAADKAAGTAATGLGGGFGAAKTAYTAAAPLLAAQPEPLTLQAPGQESNYIGPYKPTERKVRYPGMDRDPEDSSEFSYFNPSNPFPYAAGGSAKVMPMQEDSFVIDARTVSEMGNGSSNAGLERLSQIGAQPIRGPGDGVSDSIKANIGGVQEARVARDEAYMSPEAVKRLGNGSAQKGHQKLYALMEKAHQARKSAKRGENTGLGALV